jgi:FkbM family methyltransferase
MKNIVEMIRQISRKLINSKSVLYKLGSEILVFLSVTRKEGISKWRMLKGLASNRTGSLDTIPIILRNLKYPIHVRPGTEDISMIINTAIREEYGQFQPERDPEWIIDAGAYIGDTASYFLSRFPNAKVVALEPNPPAYELAFRNLKPYAERAVLLKMGLAETPQRLRFGGDYGGASTSNADFEIECTSIPALLNRFSIERIDVLKMDIEGAEKMIFQKDPSLWLNRVEMIIIEIHGADIEEIVLRVLRQNNFTVRQYRSVWYCNSAQANPICT